MSFASGAPIQICCWWDLLRVEGYEPAKGERPNTFMNSVAPGFFRAIGQRTVRGRDFDARDAQGAPTVAVVNQLLARRFFRNGEVLALDVVAAWVVQYHLWEVATRGVATVGVAVTAALAISIGTALMGGQEDSCSPTTPELDKALAAVHAARDGSPAESERAIQSWLPRTTQILMSEPKAPQEWLHLAVDLGGELARLRTYRSGSESPLASCGRRSEWRVGTQSSSSPQSPPG